MLYVQLDTNWPDNPKIIEAGVEGGWLHAVILCLAKRYDRDGWVGRTTLVTRYGARDETIDLLIDLRLLEASEHAVRPWGWHQINLSSDAIRQKKADSARAANHARWHEGLLEDCDKCKPKNPCSSDAESVISESDLSDASEADPTVSLEVEVETEGTQQQDSDPADTPAARALRFRAACAHLGIRASMRPGVRDMAAVQRAVSAGAMRDHLQVGMSALVADPELTAEELADILEPHPKAAPMPSAPQPPPISEVLAARPAIDKDLNMQMIAQLKRKPA